MLEGILYELLEKREGSAVVRILPESPIYKAHFPTYPVTPGVTILQMALEVSGLRLSAARDIKFVVPILPSAEGPVVRFEWSFPEPGLSDVRVYLPEDQLCAKMSLQYEG